MVSFVINFGTEISNFELCELSKPQFVELCEVMYFFFSKFPSFPVKNGGSFCTKPTTLSGADEKYVNQSESDAESPVEERPRSRSAARSVENSDAMPS